MFYNFVFVTVILTSLCVGQEESIWSDVDDIVSEIKCISILDCPEAMDILRHKPLTKAKEEHLRSIQCGKGPRYPKVWCTVVRPNVTTDTRLDGAERPSFLPRVEEGQCGFVDTDSKIQGGEDANLGEFPWMAWLEYRSKDNMLSGKCSGTLITNRFVLTAAHCVIVAASSGKLESILLGEYDTTNETDCIPNPWTGKQNCADPPKRYAIEKTIVHDLYTNAENAQLYHHDIALIRAAEEIVFTTYIQPICLPEPKGDQNIELFTVAGWGRNGTGQQSSILQKLRLPRFDTIQCTEVLQYNVTETQVCAGGEKGKDSCKGDSGGPLMYLSSDANLWTQMGIISIGIGNWCGVGLPAIYTDVQKHIGWIYVNLEP